MTTLTSIMTEQVNKQRSLSKLKINPNDSNTKNILKSISYMQRRLTEEDLSSTLLGEAVNSFFSIKETDDTIIEVEVSNRVNRLWRGVTFDYFIINREKNNTLLYFDMDGKLPLSKNGRSYSWRDNGSPFTVYNGKRLIAAHLLWEKITEGRNIENLEQLKRTFFDYSFIKHRYHRPRLEHQAYILALIMQSFHYELNIDLMARYETDTRKEVATALQTKKHIKESVKEAMDDTRFLDFGFTFVEFDNDTDLDKVAQLEEEWSNIKDSLTPISAMPDLRFRKLGKHKAVGLYSPSHNTICIDIRDVNSFIHEYAHLVDYKYAEDNLSMRHEFQPIVDSYREQVYLLPEDSYVRKKLNYYTTPTEVFARAYELFYFDRLPENSFLKTDLDYRTADEYACFTESTRESIDTFMLSVFDESRVLT